MLEKLRPLGDRVLVKRLQEQEKTASGLWLPDASKEKPQVGVVMAVGVGRLDTTGNRIPVQVKAGDHVYFGKYSGTELVQEDKEFLILREEELLGVLEK